MFHVKHILYSFLSFILNIVFLCLINLRIIIKKIKNGKFLARKIFVDYEKGMVIIMKEVNYKFKSNTPYSLHDMNVCKIMINDDSITFMMKDGFEEKQEPYRILKGRIIIKKDDFDFCCITLLSNLWWLSYST